MILSELEHHVGVCSAAPGQMACEGQPNFDLLRAGDSLTTASKCCIMSRHFCLGDLLIQFQIVRQMVGVDSVVSPVQTTLYQRHNEKRPPKEPFNFKIGFSRY